MYINKLIKNIDYMSHKFDEESDDYEGNGRPPSLRL